MQDSGDFFGSGIPPAKFEAPGDMIEGRIVDMEQAQQREYDPNGPGDLMWWDDEKTRPMMELRVTVATDLRDPKIEGDNGDRRIFVKGKRMTDAVRTAFRSAGAQRLEVGGILGVAFTGYDPESKNPKNPAKLYVARYSKPAATTADAFFGAQQGQPATAPAAVQPQAAPQPQANPFAQSAGYAPQQTAQPPAQPVAQPAPAAWTQPPGQPPAQPAQETDEQGAPLPPGVTRAQWDAYPEEVRAAYRNLQAGGVAVGG